MSDFLKHYEMKITALSPMHIGNGEKIGKKEYIYLPWDNTVIIPDVRLLLGEIQKKHLDRQYAEYMLKNNRDELGNWLKKQGFQRQEFKHFQKYTLNAGDTLQEPGTQRDRRTREILSFIKDPYGMPYVPGSSIKGMLRTALLAYEIMKDTSGYTSIKRQIQSGASRREKNRMIYLNRETQALETQSFHTLRKNAEKPGDAVNCNLSGLIVSDSRPISLENLVLSQKIDYTLDKKEKPLPIFREAVIPGTEIFFDVTIDEKDCPYMMEQILEALNVFQRNCYQFFYSRFGRGTKQDGTIWLGGGCGFLSKTILYEMFGKDAVGIVDQIFQNTLGKNYDIHKHNKDKALHLAPHVCKCTRYQGELYDMGMGRIEVVR